MSPNLKGVLPTRVLAEACLAIQPVRFQQYCPELASDQRLVGQRDRSPGVRAMLGWSTVSTTTRNDQQPRRGNDVQASRDLGGDPQLSRLIGGYGFQKQ